MFAEIEYFYNITVYGITFQPMNLIAEDPEMPVLDAVFFVLL
jgi:hypothetical protein